MKNLLTIFISLLSISSFSFAQTSESVQLHWIDKQPRIVNNGVTWGVPWKEGELKKVSTFELVSDTGEKLPVQSWVTAYWPDGSVKWTAHAAVVSGKDFRLEKAERESLEGIRVSENNSTITVDTKLIQCVFNKSGNDIIKSLSRNGNIIADNGKLIVIDQDNPDSYDEGTIHKTLFESVIKNVTVEQEGPIRVVVKVEGDHQSKEVKGLLPFTLRFYFYANSEAVKILHTIIYNADENKDFIKGIGLRLDVPMKDEMYNRNIRFVGEGDGVFSESVKTLTGLRRNPGDEARQAQIDGDEVRQNEFSTGMDSLLQYVPTFGDYTLAQQTDQSFSIEKRTSDGHAWLSSTTGHRTSGTGYLGTPNGGLAFGIRNFWQSYPAQLDIRNASSDKAQVTLWLWSPKAQAMDLRFYHDGMGQNTYSKQRQGLDITYEDYEPGFGIPYGVARTSEMSLWALDKTPSGKDLVKISQIIQQPPLLVCSPKYILDQGVFGGCWTLPDTTTVLSHQIEKQLKWNLDYYKKQIDEHRWYGFWNYGDFMHTYDADRHVWRYDVGGFAWDNSELSTDLWLWYSFLRTGDASIFRIAEAMTRHTGEVDVYHIGRFAPLGSRHNVMHWGCSAKQMRISTALNRRFLYYLTADERIGDLMREQVNAVKKVHDIVPVRKLSTFVSENRPQNYAYCSFGTDWGATAAAWFTEWERTNDPKILVKLTNSMKTIAAQPRMFFTGSEYMDTNTGKFEISKSNKVVVSHLNAVFGLVEICSELIQNLNVPSFKKAWLNYCELYNAPADEQKKALGEVLVMNKLNREHSRLTSYAAHILESKKMGERAWSEFLEGHGGLLNTERFTHQVMPPAYLYPVTENPYVSTNEVAEWSLNAMQNLAWAKKWMPEGK